MILRYNVIYKECKQESFQIKMPFNSKSKKFTNLLINLSEFWLHARLVDLIIIEVKYGLADDYTIIHK